MAYAALILFKQTLEKILLPHHPQIQSLMEKVCQLMDFLEDSSEKFSLTITDLEGKMRDAAYEGEDIIEFHLSTQILPKSTTSFGKMRAWIRNDIPAFRHNETIDNDLDLEIKQIQQIIERTRRDAAYEGEDIIESHLSTQILPKSTTSSGKIRAWIRNVIPAFRHNENIDNDLDLKIKKLQQIIEEFEFILESVSKMKDGKVVEHLQPTKNSLTAGPSRIASSGKSAVMGLDRDLIQIKDQLTGSSSHLEVISITGMGGIGKTTLATNLYNDSLIEYHFDIRAWVTVSQDYHLLEILRDLQNSIRHVNGESRIDQLEEKLYKSLKGRRYLIVMDDVWDTSAWDDVKRLFPDDNNGSRVILTTRISEVALYANSFNSIHQMSPLSLEESWNLLCSKVFGEESCPSEFEEIGTQIARNCKGLPLAIVVIGGLLSKGSRTQDYWEYIVRNVMSAATENDDRLMEILSLSYNYLPHHLKACFLYMGVFPEDEEILVSRLIKLWVAEGFLKPHSSKILEEVGEEYLKDLTDRNLIMVRKRDHHGEIKTCIIHDLLRDLCVKKAQEQRFLLVLNHDARGFPEVGYNEYRVSFHSLFGMDTDTDMHDSRVRSSFLFFGDTYKRTYFDFLLSYFVRFRLLKVLDALRITVSDFPDAILELVNLRYLAFTYNDRFTYNVPEAIVKLQNLQTLILIPAWFSSDFGLMSSNISLPSEIWEMQQLRHLSFKRGLLPYPRGSQLDREKSFDMVHLYTLSELVNFPCRKEVFQIMPNLKKLGIFYSKRSSYDFDSFIHLHKLETLKLSFQLDPGRIYRPVNFAFPIKLKKLTLSGCSISWNNMSIVGSLPNLEVLKLKELSCEGTVWEPNEGEFLRLKFLQLEDKNLKQWKANQEHFPKLEHLLVKLCFQLEEIPSAIGDIPTLQMLDVCACMSSVEESAKLIEVEQQNLGNDILKVCVTNSSTYFGTKRYYFD